MDLLQSENDLLLVDGDLSSEFCDSPCCTTCPEGYIVLEIPNRPEPLPDVPDPDCSVWVCVTALCPDGSGIPDYGIGRVVVHGGKCYQNLRVQDPVAFDDLPHGAVIVSRPIQCAESCDIWLRAQECPRDPGVEPATRTVWVRGDAACGCVLFGLYSEPDGVRCYTVQGGAVGFPHEAINPSDILVISFGGGPGNPTNTPNIVNATLEYLNVGPEFAPFDPLLCCACKSRLLNTCEPPNSQDVPNGGCLSPSTGTYNCSCLNFDDYSGTITASGYRKEYANISGAPGPCEAYGLVVDVQWTSTQGQIVVTDGAIQSETIGIATTVGRLWDFGAQSYYDYQETNPIGSGGCPVSTMDLSPTSMIGAPGVLFYQVSEPPQCPTAINPSTGQPYGAFQPRGTDGSGWIVVGSDQTSCFRYRRNIVVQYKDSCGRVIWEQGATWVVTCRPGGGCGGGCDEDSSEESPIRNPRIVGVPVRGTARTGVAILDSILGAP